MASVRSQAGGLASSNDGRWLVWTEPQRIVLADLQKHAQVAELALDLEPPISLAMCTNPDRVLVVQQRRGATRIRVLSVPDLKPVAEGVLEREARLVAVCGVTAVLLGGADSLTTLDLGDLRATTMTVRGPIQLVAPFSENQILIVARGKVETWSLEERRPTHRLSLALPKNPGFAGTAANETLLWAASTDAPGTVTAFRLAEGTQLEESTLDGSPLAVLSHPTTPTLVAVVQGAGEATNLVALDLTKNHARALPCDASIAAACVIGAPADAVAVLPERGAPFLVPLAGGPIRTIALPENGAVPVAMDEPAAVQPTAAASVAADRLDEWRAQVQAAVHAQAPASATTTRIIRTEEPQSRTRAELFAWGETVRNRRSSAPPPPPQVWRLTELAQRFDLDLRSRTLLALLYASWLDGEGRTGMPVAHIARALGNDELAWIEGLAQGRLGRLGWVRSDHGRTRLRATIGRFLDEAKPRVAIVAPASEPAGTLEPPVSPAVWRDATAEITEEQVRDLATACRVSIARIDVDQLPPAHLRRALDERIFEARLHGALPLLIARSVFDPDKLSGSLLLAFRGASPSTSQSLPQWPPAREAAEATAS